MSRLTDQEVEAIARSIVWREGLPPQTHAENTSHSVVPDPDLGIFPTIEDAVRAARRAQLAWVGLPLAKRRGIIASVRSVMLEKAEELARAAHEETGMGRFLDKVTKNRLVTEKTPGVEDLNPISYTGDHGFTLIEPAPFGVVGAITPTTNPTSTIICNAIGMIAAGNSVVFNVHPNAARCSAQTIVEINRCMMAEGGPAHVICAAAHPTIQSAQDLMHHPDVRLVVVTGGPGVVKAAQQSGKRAICAGPGNPPVVVDETADIGKAARDIVYGSSFDNNIVCVLEKEAIVVDAVADELLAAMRYSDAMVLDAEHFRQLEKVIFTEMGAPRSKGKVNPIFIGKNASVLLHEIGVQAPDTLRLIVAELPVDHPLLWTEQMMPVLPVTRVAHADEAIDLAVAMEGGCRHTAVMHSKHVDRLSTMARKCDCSIFVKNGMAVAGLGHQGEGYCSFTISSPTGEGLTGPRSFSRWRRCTLVDAFRIT